jgi:acyl-CoA thioester hydrolase
MTRKDDSFRHALDAYPVQRTLSIRVCDLDGYGHLNAIRLGHFYEDARASFYRTAFVAVQLPRLLVAQLTIRYLQEAHWPGALRVGTGISRLGSSSVTMVQGLFDEASHCLGLCETVLVNTGGGGSAPIPADARAVFEEYLVRAPVTA